MLHRFFRIARRILAAACCMIWLSTSALADGVRFTLSADVEPSAWPGDDRKLATVLDALLETMVIN